MGKLYLTVLYVLTLTCLVLSGGEVYAQSGFPYCEPFTQSTTRANTITGGDNTRLTSGTVDPEGEGVLRLTSNATNQSGYVYVDIPFSSKFGIKTSFEYFTYGGTGADGFTMFLFDALVNQFATGGFGGALGYAQRGNIPGLSGGYIGIGFDEFGNFGNTENGKIGGLGGNNTTRYANSVIIRGPRAENYKFIQGRRTNNITNGSIPGLTAENQFPIASGGEGTNRISDPNQVGYRKVFIDMVPAANGVGFTITLKMEVTTTINAPREVTIFDAVSYPFPPPQNLKIGFAGSTGGSTNFHEIRNLVVEVSDDLNLLDPIANEKSIEVCNGRQNIIEIKAFEDVELFNDPDNNFIRCLQLGKNLTDFPAEDIDICNSEQCDTSRQTLATTEGQFEADAEGGIIRFTPGPNMVGNEVIIYYTVTDNFGKTSEPKPIKIKVNPTPNASITTEDNTNFFVGEKATLIANEDQNLSYQWFKDGEVIPNATNSAFEALESGAYHVVTKNEFGCQNTSTTISITTTIPPPLIVDLISTKSEICQNEGEATFKIQNYFEPAYYKVIRTGGQIIHDWTLISNENLIVDKLGFGDYSIMVYDRLRSIDEPIIRDFTIRDQRDIAVEVLLENIQCIDGTTGKIRFDLTNVTPPRSIRARYKVDGGVFNSGSIISQGGNQVLSEYLTFSDGTKNFPEGKYIVQVYRNNTNPDTDGCFVEFTIDIRPPAGPLFATVIQELDVCPVNHTTVLPSGGWGEYTFLWSNGMTTQTASGLPAGTYSVTVTDKEGCTYEVDEIEIPVSDSIFFNDDIVNPSCGLADGEIQILDSNLDYDRHEITWRKNDPVDGEIITGNEFGATGLSEGIYYLILKEIVAGNCNEFFREYTLKNKGTPVMIDVDNQEVCEGEAISFTPSIESNNPSITYQWYMDSKKNYPIHLDDVVFKIMPNGSLEIESLPYSEDLYEFFVEVTGEGVCESIPDELTKVSVNVKPKPMPPLVNANGGYPRTIN